MSPRIDSSWLDVAVGDNKTFIIRDYGQLEYIVSGLPNPKQQIPKISVFLGGGTKDSALQALFPYNNIRRTRSTASIGLRVDNLSVENGEPYLFVDGEVGQSISSPHQAQATPGPGVQDHPIAWKAASAQAAVSTIFSRLVFLFADVVCIFVDDFPSIKSCARFLLECGTKRSASSLPVAVRPRVIVVMGGSSDRAREQAEEFKRVLRDENCDHLPRSFSGVNFLSVDRSTDACFRDRLRASIRGRLEDMREARRDNGALFSGLHLQGLFDLAVKHLALCKDSPFNFIKATREGNPVSHGLSHHISHYFDIGNRGGCSLGTLVSSTASALLMDHYLPDNMLLEPRAVFRTLYRSPIIRGMRDYEGQMGQTVFGTPVDDITGQVESEFVSQFYSVVSHGTLTADHRRDHLLTINHELGKVQSAKICLYCLVRTAQHPQSCHHALCDQCAQIFGYPAHDAEYQFTVSTCLICLSGGTMVIDVLPPTMNPTILAIDGGGVRGGIPLEYLLLIQESLGPQCKIQELVDLSVGSSSGGLIILGLMGMGWDVSTCSQVFDRLARRIFRNRRRMMLSRIFRFILGRDSVLGGILQWVSWLLHDSCYDPRVFDASLREAFGESHRIFDVVDTGSGFHSRYKFGVIATTISKETKSFVFGNFNSADMSLGEHEHELFRAHNIHGEPLIWEVARATAAAPLDGFLRRGYDALMSNLDTEPKWLELKNQLDDDVKDDYLRLDVNLRDIPCTIDDASAMDDYRNLVIAQAGTARRAREVATALLVARFYFELDGLSPQLVHNSCWYRGTIRCKGPAKKILEALQKLYSTDADFVTDTGFLGQFGALEDCCAQCGRYVKSVSVFIHHPKEPFNIYIRTGRQKRWRISGFPASLASFMEVENLHRAFGRPSHGRPAAAPCTACDSWDARLQGKGRKRTRGSATDASGIKRLCIVGDVQD
ncbi:uncharacterized protein ATNIH1004_011302 [Aspergillus tanneri]|uniref:PNPLA domain-containing protein n=1 Tax=Aspergillus tanneri TaxID=1220188 RepID=A0A5M9M6C6_9EURO|nr:uncharacterized protein ATNIH1004_011302 [Aspergillus tanneri]KAA8642358.1 hypothetical protein ATNIH1004_011302 [Aspergillus tanneri]